MCGLPLSALAGTTGTLRGRVVDAGTACPDRRRRGDRGFAPSQTASDVSDASGELLVHLAQPDTYTVSATKTGYEPQSQPGVSIFADQSARSSLSLQTARSRRSPHDPLESAASRSCTPASRATSSRSTPPVRRPPRARRLRFAHASLRRDRQRAGRQHSLEPSRAGIRASTSAAATSTKSPTSSTALPTTRQSDLAPIATLTSPGQSGSAGLHRRHAGDVELLGPRRLHQPSHQDRHAIPVTPAATSASAAPRSTTRRPLEVAGATPDRLFSYYVGLSGTNQAYRYGDQFNGAGDPLYFYPLIVPTSNTEYNILDGSGGTGPNYGRIRSPATATRKPTNFDRENVFNVHFGIPHHNSPLRDDMQRSTSPAASPTQFYSSANDIGINPTTAGTTGIRVSAAVPRLATITTVADAGAQPEPDLDRAVPEQPVATRPVYGFHPAEPARRQRATATRSKSCSIRRTSTTIRTSRRWIRRILRLVHQRTEQRAARLRRATSPTTKCSSTATAPI